MIPNDFCVFILTHGRPEKLHTLTSLERHGYTGPYYIVIDNEDKTAEQYYRLYGDKVIMFDKAATAATFDEGDCFHDRRAIIYARNACFQIARERNFKYFPQLDDDYTCFVYKKDENFEYRERPIKNLDQIILLFLEYYKTIPALSIAMAQNGDFIGGAGSTTGKKFTKRKAMNTFFCSTDRPFQFFGRINEDVNVYTTLGHRGDLFLTVLNVAIIQKQTQTNTGGMTDIYQQSGTYIKSFYSVMYSPSFVTVQQLGVTHKRFHHNVSWEHATPLILHEKYRKKTLSAE